MGTIGLWGVASQGDGGRVAVGWHAVAAAVRSAGMGGRQIGFVSRGGCWPCSPGSRETRHPVMMADDQGSRCRCSALRTLHVGAAGLAVSHVRSSSVVLFVMKGVPRMKLKVVLSNTQNVQVTKTSAT